MDELIKDLKFLISHWNPQDHTDQHGITRGIVRGLSAKQCAIELQYILNAFLRDKPD